MIHGLAKRLRKCRKEQHLSQKEVADSLSVSPAIISGYETGERTPSSEVLLKLSGFYRCSADYLLGLDQRDPSKFLDVSELNEDQIKAVKMLIETIKK